MLTVSNNVNLATLNTMRVGSYARRLVEWETAEDLNTLLTDEKLLPLRQAGIKPIGEGSNLLFIQPDCDLTLLHCKSNKYSITAFSDTEVFIEADAGLRLDQLIEITCIEGLWGLENLSLIPGTVGAAAVQNVGAYGVEFKDVVHSVNCFDLYTNELCCFEAATLDYGYRESMFKKLENHGRYIVVSVVMVLKTTPSPKLSYGNLREMIRKDCEDPTIVRRTIIDMRRNKLPEVTEVGSAGSFFKNPVIGEVAFSNVKNAISQWGINPESMPVYLTSKGYKLSAAWLIDMAGGKKIVMPHVGVWPTQPLVIINRDGKATGEEIAQFASKLSNLVHARFGVMLEPEVEYIN